MANFCRQSKLVGPVQCTHYALARLVSCLVAKNENRWHPRIHNCYPGRKKYICNSIITEKNKKLPLTS